MPTSALLHGSTIAATSWTIDKKPHLRVYTQDVRGGIRESRYDGKWTGGTSKDVIVKAKPHSPIAAVNVDSGAKIHVFYLNSEDYLCEVIRDASGNWAEGPLNKQKNIAFPTTRLSAFGPSRNKKMSLQYQNNVSGALNEISYQDESVHWVLTWSGDTEKPLYGTGLASFPFSTSDGDGVRVLYQLADGTFAESGIYEQPKKRITEITSLAAHGTHLAATVTRSSTLTFQFHFIGVDNMVTEWGFYSGGWKGPNHPGHTLAAPGSGIAVTSASENDDSWRLYFQQGSQIVEYSFTRGLSSDWAKSGIVPTEDVE